MPSFLLVFSSRQPIDDSDRRTGLLGAALSQYQPGIPESINAKKESQPNALVRRSSGGNLMLSSESRTFSFTNERRRAASPLPTLFQQQPRDISVLSKPHPQFLSSQPADYTGIHYPQPNRSIINRDMSSSGLSTDSANMYQSQNTIHQSSSSFHRNPVRWL